MFIWVHYEFGRAKGRPLFARMKSSARLTKILASASSGRRAGEARLRCFIGKPLGDAAANASVPAEIVVGSPKEPFRAE
jgi:hypothetical protein